MHFITSIDYYTPLLDPLIGVVGAVVASDSFSSLDGFLGDHQDAQGSLLSLLNVTVNFKFTVSQVSISMVAQVHQGDEEFVTDEMVFLRAELPHSE